MGEPKHGEGYVKLVKLISNKNEAENKKFGVLISHSCKRNNLFFYNIKDAFLEKCKIQIEQREKYREEIEITQKTLGTINLIGHFYRYHLVTPKIISNCTHLLLENIKDPHPMDIEAACKLLKMTERVLLDRCCNNNSNKNEFHIANCLVSNKLKLIYHKLNKLFKNILLENRIRFICQDLIEGKINFIHLFEELPDFIILNEDL